MYYFLHLTTKPLEIDEITLSTRDLKRLNGDFYAFTEAPARQTVHDSDYNR